MAIGPHEVSDCLKEIGAKFGYPFVTDCEIFRIVPFRGEIAVAVELDLNPRQILAVLPDYIAAQERIIQGDIVGLFRELFLQTAPQGAQHFRRTGQPPPPGFIALAIASIAQADKRSFFPRKLIGGRRSVEHGVAVDAAEQRFFTLYGQAFMIGLVILLQKQSYRLLLGDVVVPVDPLAGNGVAFDDTVAVQRRKIIRRAVEIDCCACDCGFEIVGHFISEIVDFSGQRIAVTEDITAGQKRPIRHFGGNYLPSMGD